MMAINRFCRIFVLVSAIALVGCQKEDERIVAFVGDSITARWDIQLNFPMYITQNYGRRGATIDHIHGLSGQMVGKTAVVLIGTNDENIWDDSYFEKYKAYVKDLDANDVIIVSILPRKWKDDRESINKEIEVANGRLKAIADDCAWKYVDAFTEFSDNGSISINYFSDGLHLSDQGYELLGNLIGRALR